jgi:hypothetical protein
MPTPILAGVIYENLPHGDRDDHGIADAGAAVGGAKIIGDLLR